MKKITIENLQLMPMTKALLINYVLFMYEGDGVATDEYLVMEYNILSENNNLQDLFFQEYLDRLWEEESNAQK